MYRTDNPVSDYNRYIQEQNEENSHRPKCSECGEPITSEHCYAFDGAHICPECIDNNHRAWTEEISVGEEY